MSLAKNYSYEATKEAIERADGNHINVYKMVRNDVTNDDWTRPKIKPANRNQAIPEALRWPGRRDVGHTFRHLDHDAAPADKSVYCDSHTAISVTQQILNSAQGQAALQRLQGERRDLYDNTTIRVTADITGVWFGKANKAGSKKQIVQARCEITKLGASLWVHSTYPTRFAGALSEAS